MSGISVDDLKNGIPLYGSDIKTYSTTINLKKFYTEMVETFSKYKCKDSLDIGYYAKEGEVVNEKPPFSNRTYNMYEKKFYYNDVGQGAKEFELIFQAKRNTNVLSDGYVTFHFDLVCRRITNKEILLDNNQKEILQQGNWEQRNKITYFNPTLAKKCEKLAKFIPFLGKNSPNIILNIFFKHEFHEDFHDAAHTIAPIMTSVISKHFQN